MNIKYFIHRRAVEVRAPSAAGDTDQVNGTSVRRRQLTETVTGPPWVSARSSMLDGTRNTRPGEAGHGSVFVAMTRPSWRTVTFGMRMS